MRRDRLLKILLAVILLVVSVTATFLHRGGKEDGFFSNIPAEQGRGKPLTRQAAISQYWDEIREYVEGTDTLQACSVQSGDCFEALAGISNGVIQEVYFDNGDSMYVEAPLDANGRAAGDDPDGSEWRFTLSMDSTLIDEAIDAWAAATDRRLVQAAGGVARREDRGGKQAGEGS